MDLMPLSDRVWIKPDETPTETASGLHLIEHWHPEQTGTVIAVGCVKHPRKEEAEALAAKVERFTRFGETWDRRDTFNAAAQLLRDLTGREPSVKVGDRVVFSYSAGQELTVNDGDERYLILREADLLAVIEDAPV